MGNIVWLASYPKSGNTWMRAFIYNLIEEPARPGAIEQLPTYFESESKPRWYAPHVPDGAVDGLDFERAMQMRPTVHADIAASRPRGSIFVKTHNANQKFDDQPIHNWGVTAGAVYVVRNPLDVVLSLADHMGLTIDEAIDFMGNDDTGSATDEADVASYLGSWSTHVTSWTVPEHEQIVVVRYEDLLDKPVKPFTKVARLLGLGQDRKAIAQAIRHSSFRELRRQEDQSGFVERSPNSKRFFRSGRKNQWIEQLSDDQARRICERHREQMARFGYLPPKYR